MARLHVLGSGGWVPTAQRQTCCYLLESRRSVIIFDCGTGLCRLHDPALQIVLKRHTRAVVLLSHWHHDHIEGLHYLPYFLKEMEVVLGVPGKTLVGRAPAKLLERFAGRPFLPTPIADWGAQFPRGFTVQELEPGRNEVLGEEVLAFSQPHTDPSVGYRVRDVAYVTDTGVRDETVALAEDAALLIHDAYLDDDGAREAPDVAAVHGVASDVAQLAGQARVGDLLLGHINPAYDPNRLDRMLIAACDMFRRTILATDMMVLNVKAADDAETPEEPGEAESLAEPDEAESAPSPAETPSEEPEAGIGDLNDRPESSAAANPGSGEI